MVFTRRRFKNCLWLNAIIEKNPDVLEDAEAVLEDLQAMARVLIHLCERDISWHLAIDI